MTTSMLAITRPANPASQSFNVRLRATVPPMRGSSGKIPREPSGRFVAPCRSSTATAIAATNRLRKNSCNWWAAATPRPGRNPGFALSRARLSDKSADPSISFRSLNEFATFRNRAIGGSPGHDRHRGRRILRRSFDQLVGINHIDQYIPLGVAAANDLHLLEEQRAPLPEHIVALLHLALEVDWTDLPAGQ